MTRQDWHPLAGLALLIFIGTAWMAGLGILCRVLWP